MVKGVNRLVLEIPQPESAYFEKILFFVKPECAEVSEGALKNKAADLIRSADGAPGAKWTGRRRRLSYALRYLLCSAAGAALFAVLQGLLR